MGRQRRLDKASYAPKASVNQRIDAQPDQRPAQCLAIIGGARQTLAGQSIRQSGDAPAAVDIGDKPLQLAQGKAIAANVGNAGRRSGHG